MRKFIFADTVFTSGSSSFSAKLSQQNNSLYDICIRKLHYSLDGKVYIGGYMFLQVRQTQGINLQELTELSGIFEGLPDNNVGVQKYYARFGAPAHASVISVDVDFIIRSGNGLSIEFGVDFVSNIPYDLNANVFVTYDVLNPFER